MSRTQSSDGEGPPRRTAMGAARAMRLTALGLIAFLLLAVAAAWIGREALADRFIEDYLESAGVAATYDVEEIGAGRQVIRNLVIGDPAQPDLTVERAEVFISPRIGLPDVTGIRLVRPRLFGRITDGTISFGALDPLIFTGGDAPFELPDMDLEIEDGRALLEGEYGAIGLSLSGSGPLRDGFSAELAAVAPDLRTGGCRARSASLYGLLHIRGGQPDLAGPLRLAGLECPAMGLVAGATTLDLGFGLNETLDHAEGGVAVQVASLRASQGSGRDLDGTVRFVWNGAARNAGLTLRYDLAGNRISTGGVVLDRAGVEGAMRARADFARIDISGTLQAQGLNIGAGIDRQLASFGQLTAGTLAQPLLRKLRGALAAQLPGSGAMAEYDLRLRNGRVALSVPQARLRSMGGDTLLAMSRMQLSYGGSGLPLLSGNFSTAGRDMPQLSGRVEQRGEGATRLRLRMAPYSAGGSMLAVPELAVVQQANGATGFSGQVQASGALPGGSVQGLLLPISGNLTNGGQLSLWRDCTQMRFDRLRFANLSLDRRSLTLCPAAGRPILRSGPGGLAVAAGAPSLDLAGRLGETPIAIRTGAIGFAWPGALTARQIAITLGPRETATSFTVEDLSARIGDEIGGTFSGTDVRLAAVPLDLLGAGGNWRYADGAFAIDGGAFRLEDRQEQDRFKPMIARGAALTLADNVIRAQATLREPASDRTVTDVAIVHDLSTAAGTADLTVAGLLFDEALQPVQLTEMARGVVANVAGTVRGSGRIVWNAESVTSGGRFSSDSLNLAAAFGPVTGASGTVEFTDLLSLTTAPGQQIRVAAVNPGIEVADGLVTFQLVGGELLRLEGGRWPFLGGTLVLQPLDMRFGNAETRRYVFDIEGLEAIRFIEHMELSNLSVTGVFDGTMPVVFDEMGNGRLEGGVLVSRRPGGNLSYIGQLTYEDMGAIPNYAFQALRSLDYRQMFIQMDGSLVGEIVTRVRLDGVSQGAGAKRNFLTRQIAKLPVRLDVNIRAPFYSLISSVRAMYDPASIRDPREIGLLDKDGAPVKPSPIQPPESEQVP